MYLLYGDLNENDPHWLMYLNVWFRLVELFKKKHLGCGLHGAGVLLVTEFEVSKIHPICP